MSPSFPASSRSNLAARSLSRALGTISLSAKSRAVSWIRCCSSLRSRSTTRSLWRSERLLEGALEGVSRLRRSRPRHLQLPPVDRRDRLHLSHGRREERLGGAVQV